MSQKIDSYTSFGRAWKTGISKCHIFWFLVTRKKSNDEDWSPLSNAVIDQQMFTQCNWSLHGFYWFTPTLFNKNSLLFKDYLDIYSTTENLSYNNTINANKESCNEMLCFYSKEEWQPKKQTKTCATMKFE